MAPLGKIRARLLELGGLLFGFLLAGYLVDAAETRAQTADPRHDELRGVIRREFFAALRKEKEARKGIYLIQRVDFASPSRGRVHFAWSIHDGQFVLRKRFGNWVVSDEWYFL